MMELRKEKYKTLWDCFCVFYQEQLRTLVSKGGFNFNVSVDYLDGILDYRAKRAMQRACDRWFDDNVQIAGDVAQQNASLYDFYKNLPMPDLNDEDARLRSDCTTMLKDVIDRKNEQLMSLLLTVTKKYFTSGKYPVIEDYQLYHHFTYYYIMIRDKEWSRGFDFGWYPLGMEKLCKDRALTLYFNFNGQRLDSRLEGELTTGFSYHEKSRTYRIVIAVPDSGSFLDLNEEKQKLFLETAYNEYVIPVIKNVLPRIV